MRLLGIACHGRTWSCFTPDPPTCPPPLSAGKTEEQRDVHGQDESRAVTAPSAWWEVGSGSQWTDYQGWAETRLWAIVTVISRVVSAVTSEDFYFEQCQIIPCQSVTIMDRGAPESVLKKSPWCFCGPSVWEIPIKLTLFRPPDACVALGGRPRGRRVWWRLGRPKHLLSGTEPRPLPGLSRLMQTRSQQLRKVA